MGFNFPKFNGNKSSSDSASQKQPLKERMAEKIGDMKAKIELGASKDMLNAARDSKEPMGGALNAQKSDKGKEGAGNYKYKTDSLVKMLDGLVAKFDPALAKTGSEGVKKRSASIMFQIRESALNAADFKGGLQAGVRQVMRGYEMDPRFKAGAGSRDASLQNKELKIIEEVLTTLASRMSPNDGDKYGLKKNKPSERDGSDRSVTSQPLSQRPAAHRDLQEIEDSRQSRVYHAKLAKNVKNMGGALKETARKTGAAIRTYTEPATRPVALGGLKTARGAAVAGEAVADAAKDLGHHVDHAQAFVRGTAHALVAGTTSGLAQAGKDLGKGTVDTAKKHGTGAKKAAQQGVAKGKDKYTLQMDKARARKNPENQKGVAQDARRAPLTRDVDPPSGPVSVRDSADDDASLRPSLSRSSSRSSISSTTSSASSRSSATTDTYKSGRSNLSSSSTSSNKSRK